jgi:hypothetical protein
VRDSESIQTDGRNVELNMIRLYNGDLMALSLIDEWTLQSVVGDENSCRLRPPDCVIDVGSCRKNNVFKDKALISGWKKVHRFSGRLRMMAVQASW